MLLQGSIGLVLGVRPFLASALGALRGLMNPLNENPFRQVNVVVGNEAADADSIVSSVCLAYIKQLHQQSLGKGDVAVAVQQIPLCSIPRVDLTLRRDVGVLFDMAGLDINDLICLEDCPLSAILDVEEPKDVELNLTLTDHNSLQSILGDSPELRTTLGGRVQEIVDHHADKGCHMHVPAALRNIAYDSAEGKELAGSACTLVAEILFSTFPSLVLVSSDFDVDARDASFSSNPLISIDSDTYKSIPDVSTIARLLAGTILVDTANMNPTFKKGTPRDDKALKALFGIINHEDTVTISSEEKVSMGRFERDDVFKRVNGAKTEQSFWIGLSAVDALRLDYKQFFSDASASDAQIAKAVGVSAVLLDPSLFLEKIDVYSAVSAYLSHSGSSISENNKNTDVFVVMCLDTTGKIPQRSMIVLAWASSEGTSIVKALDDYLILKGTALELHNQQSLEIPGSGTSLGLIGWKATQGNLRMSRKQVAPLLEDFLGSYSL